MKVLRAQYRHFTLPVKHAVGLDSECNIVVYVYFKNTSRKCCVPSIAISLFLSNMQLDLIQNVPRIWRMSL